MIFQSLWTAVNGLLRQWRERPIGSFAKVDVVRSINTTSAGRTTALRGSGIFTSDKICIEFADYDCNGITVEGPMLDSLWRYIHMCVDEKEVTPISAEEARLDPFRAWTEGLALSIMGLSDWFGMASTKTGVRIGDF